MNAFALIELSLSILNAVLANTKHNPALDLVVKSVQAAIDELEKVRGSEVTKAQLEGLRVPQVF